MNKACFECDLKQMTKIVEFLGLDQFKKEELMSITDHILNHCDMSKTNPEIMAEIWQAITPITKIDNPYKQIKTHYNKLTLSMSNEIKRIIDEADAPFIQAIKVVITGNLIDFAAKHQFNEMMFKQMIHNASSTTLAIDDSLALKDSLLKSRTLLYLGDNCGEIAIDKVFIELMKSMNLNLKVYYGVRGKAIVNDVTLDDASEVGMAEVATVISNGNGCLGTVLELTSNEFQSIFKQADMIICKGQGNYEGLLGNSKENLFFMFMAKCELVAQPLGLDTMSIVCLKNRQDLKWGNP